VSDVGVRPGACGDRGVDGGEGLRVRVRDSSKESGSSCRRGIVGYQAVGKTTKMSLGGHLRLQPYVCKRKLARMVVRSGGGGYLPLSKY